MSENKKNPNIDLTTILKRLMEVISRDFNCIKIGTIQAFDKTNQTATVKITLKRLVDISSKGVKTFRELPVLLQVPCVIISGGGSYLNMPIAEGDNCLLLFSDEDLDSWLSTNEETPLSTRRHDLSDAICLVGLSGLSNAIEDYEDDKIKLQFSKDISLTMGLDGNILKGDSEIDGKLNVKDNLEVDGTIKATDEISAPTMKPANGATGASTPGTGNVTFVNGIITAFT